MSETILGSANSLGKCNDEIKHFEQNFTSNQNRNIKINVDFSWVSGGQQRKLRVRLCTCISEMIMGCAYWTRCAK